MVSRVFIYGAFGDEEDVHGLVPPPTVRDLSPLAIEILREFSPLELIGKVYVLTQGRNYQAVTPLGVRNYGWYNEYRLASIGTKDPHYYFRVKDGDVWRVLWMRQESDDSGPYIAVAIRHD